MFCFDTRNVYNGVEQGCQGTGATRFVSTFPTILTALTTVLCETPDHEAF